MKLENVLIHQRMSVPCLVALALAAGLARPSAVRAQHECDGCDDCDHADTHEVGATDETDHADHDHSDHDDHDGTEAAAEVEHDEHGHEEEGLRLSPGQRERFGIAISIAGPGSLRNEVSLPGEIVFNEDRVVHMVPRAPGITVDVHKTLGDPVRAGDVLALIDSAELASAKLDYVAAVTEVGCCQFEFPRARAIHDNTLELLRLLDESPPLEQLRGAVPGETGDYRSRLISAYAEYVRTGKEYERERTLATKKVSSEGDFLAAESAFKSAQARYWGTRDSAAYEVRQSLLETTRERQLAEFEAETAAQKLRMLGLSEAALAGLAAGLPAGEADEGQARECTDPNCTDCAANHGDATGQTPSASQPVRANLGWYKIKAPFDGVIVQKHITRGERVGDDADIFTIADTSSVWVNLTVYTRNLASVRKGQEVVLRVDHSGAQARGRVAMITPFIDESTRSATARIVLDNHDGRWVPGAFVTGFVSNSEDNLPVVVSRDAVQTIEGRDVVFVEHEDGLEMAPVTTGRADRTNVEIVAGLAPGTRYVSGGAFQLKATVITSTLDSHAGHGH